MINRLIDFSDVARHAPRLIFLEYVGEGKIDTTLMLVGKVNTHLFELSNWPWDTVANWVEAFSFITFNVIC